MIASLALVAALAPNPAPDPRPLDPSVPTSVPAPEGDDVPIDGAAMVDDDAPEPTPAPAPRAKAAAPEETEESKPREWAMPNRRGVLLLASVGAGGCGQDQCEALKVVPWFGLTAGYRFGRFAPIVTIQGGAGPAKAPSSLMTTEATVVLDSASDTRTFLNIGAGTLLHLLVKSRFDPYFGLTLGYLRSTAHSKGAGTVVDMPGVRVEYDTTEVVHRGSLGVVIGLALRLGHRWTLGPRVDVLVPFRGKACVRQGDGGSTCTELGDLESIDPGQYFPRPWSATLQIGVVL